MTCQALPGALGGGADGPDRVNIQRGKDDTAKAYQVRQVLDAIARLEAEKNEESDNDA